MGRIRNCFEVERGVPDALRSVLTTDEHLLSLIRICHGRFARQFVIPSRAGISVVIEHGVRRERRAVGVRRVILKRGIGSILVGGVRAPRPQPE